MTTFFQFQPSQVSPFAFSPTLDGQIYNATVPSLVFGNRPYLNLVALDGTLILLTALIGSPTGFQLASLSWVNGIVSATMTLPHGFKVASTISLTLVGSTPAAYNGQIAALITGPSSFSYPLASNPGSATIFGAANFNVNLVGGVAKEDGTFFQSTLVFRTPANQFEVSP